MSSDARSAIQPDQASATPSLAWKLDDLGAMEQRLEADLAYLASDELGGRGPFTEGLEKAALHVARQFRAAGLRTERFGETPFQVFRSSIKLTLGAGNQACWRFPGHSAARTGYANGTTSGESASLASGELVLQRDYTPLSLSGTGDFDLPVLFVGYGITCPDWGVDDYRGLDARGRLVIVLRHAPADRLALARKSKDKRESSLVAHTYLARKVDNALEHGAAGVLFVSSARDSNDDLLPFQVEGQVETPSIPVLQVRRAVLDELLSSAGQPKLAEIERGWDASWPDVPSRLGAPATADASESEDPVSAAVGSRATLDGHRLTGRVVIEKRLLTLKNVLGELPGRGDLADETVIVGAHYDHLGNGGISSLAPWTKAIHNGADDNASGTSALLEVARQVARKRGSEHARRVLFVAFSAEEMGLIGSERFVASPPVPLDNVVAMVNLDMVGRLRDDRLTVSGVGTAREFSPLVQRLASQHLFRAKLDPSGLGPSDHATFAARGIPVLHFFTGLHEDYHRPSDDAERINVAGLRRISSLVTDTVLELAQAENRPTPTRGGLDGILADMLRSGADERPTSKKLETAATPTTGRNRGLGISLVESPAGAVSVRRVTPGSAAQRAGLRTGDVLRRIGENEVSTSEEVLAAVREQASSATLSLRIERGATELELELSW